MRKLFLLLVLSCLYQAVLSQTTPNSSLKGSVQDTLSDKQLSNAVITLLNSKDSVLVKFTRTDQSGNFQLPGIAPGKYVLMVSYPKFADFTDVVDLTPDQTLDLGMIPLTKTSVLLQEVIVRNNMAIRMKGDTTEFTADSFKVKEGATVEDLLKVIPGMQVNSKGEVTSQGKRVDKVLVDGEEFFGADPTIATQNIGAKAVDKVQVFDTKTDADQLKGIGGDASSGKTINIKLKDSAKKGHFGKLEASSNFDGLFDAKAMFNKFQGTKKISIFGTKSNTTTGSLGWEERNKLGIENDFEYDELSGIGYSFGSDDQEFSNWNLRGLPDAYTAGALFGDRFKDEKIKLNASYLYNRLGTTNNTSRISQTLLEDTTFFNNSSSSSRGLAQQHVLNGKYEWKLDSLATLKLTAVGTYKEKESTTNSYSEAINEEGQLVNMNNRVNDLLSKRKQLDNQLVYTQLFKKLNRTLITTLRLGLVDEDQTGTLLSTTNFYRNGVLDSIDLIDQQKINSTNTTTMGARVTFSEPLSTTWNIITEYSYNRNKTLSNRNSFERDLDDKYTEVNPLFSNNFDMNAISNSGTLTARYQGKKLRVAFGAGVSAIQLNLNNLDLNEKNKYNFTNFTPQAQFGYRFKPQTSLGFYYRGRTVQPSLNQLQPLQNNNDPLSIYTGNPDLKVGFNHSLGLNFNDFKVLKGQYIFGNLGVNFVQNAITNYSTVDSFGKTTYVPINVDGNYNWNYWFVWNSGQGDKKLIHEISPNASGGRSRNFINGKDNTNTYANIGLNYQIRYSVQDKYNFSIGPEINRNISKSSLRPGVNNNYWSYGGRLNAYVMLPGKIEISTDLEARLQESTDAFQGNVNITVWNAELSRKFFKDRSLKIGVIAHDILNQNIGFDRTINSNFISQERYDRLARYFLLTASWTFNKMPGK